MPNRGPAVAPTAGPRAGFGAVIRRLQSAGRVTIVRPILHQIGPFMSNETIFREVDEELRGDRLRALWRRFGPYVIGAAVAVVLLVAANEGWSWWQNSNAARSSDQFYGALELAENGDIAGAQAALNDVVAQGSGGYPTLARFRQASLLARDGKTQEAVAAYDTLATSETNPRLRELALVMAAYLLVDNGDVSAVLQRVGGLAVPDNPMRNAAREAIGLTQYKAGDLSAAVATFGQILADPVVGQEARSRADMYMAQLISQGAAATPTDEAAAEAEPAEVVPEVAPAMEAPAMEAPAMEAPAMEAPAMEAPPAEAPAN